MGALRERDADLATLAGLLDGTTRRDGAAVLVEGPAGIGKTALLGALASGAAGARVLTARGSEMETAFGFGAVRQLFEREVLAASEERRRELLAGPAAACAPLLEGGAPVTADAFALAHGLFWLAANLAEREPLLIVVDDAQWVDEPSLDWLAYLARRVTELPVLLVAGARVGAGGEALDRLRTEVTRTATLGALSAAGVADMLEELCGARPPEGFVEECRHATGGIPFYVAEVAAAIAERSAHAGWPRVEELVSERFAAHLTQRLGALGDREVAVAQACTVLGDGAELVDLARLADITVDAARDVVDHLARHGLMTASPPRLTHDLIRAAVYERMPPSLRTTLHLRAARALQDRGAGPQALAAQLLRAGITDDPWAAELEASLPAELVRRGAAAAAADLLEQSLGRPQPSERRAALLLQLGAVRAHRLGDLRGVDLLLAAHAELADAGARAHTAVVAAQVLNLASRGREGLALLAESLGEIGDEDPELRLTLLASRTFVRRVQGTEVPSDLSDLSELRLAQERDTPAGRFAQAALAAELSCRYVERDEMVARARVALADPERYLEDLSAGRTLYVAMAALAGAGEPQRALDAIATTIEQARRDGSRTHLTLGHVWRAVILLDGGRIREAEEDARFALELFDDRTRSLVQLYGRAATAMSRAQLERGRLDEARATLEEVGSRLAPGSTEYWALEFLSARARLCLETNEPAAAYQLALQCGELASVSQLRNPTIDWRRTGALAAARLDRGEEGLALAREELRTAEAFGVRAHIGRAQHTVALAGPAEGRREQLEQAVESLRGTYAQLHYAEAMTDLGAELRRGRRRAAAREPLARGLDLATRLGATREAARAHQELLATGARPRRLVLTGIDSLTASERRIARLAAGGATNKQIAQTLYVTPKTVEAHLSAVFRKLDVRSRGDLEGVFAQRPDNGPKL